MKNIFLPGEADILTVPFHVWFFHFCLFLTLFFCWTSKCWWCPGVLPTSLFILYLSLDWLIHTMASATPGPWWHLHFQPWWLCWTLAPWIHYTSPPGCPQPYLSSSSEALVSLERHQPGSRPNQETEKLQTLLLSLFFFLCAPWFFCLINSISCTLLIHSSFSTSTVFCFRPPYQNLPGALVFLCPILFFCNLPSRKRLNK